MTPNSPASPGPDLFFAGGECLSRFGVWVRRTDMDLEEATGEIFTRNGDNSWAVGRDGLIRSVRANLPRAEYLNEVDLDATRNLTHTTFLETWSGASGAPVIQTLAPGVRYRVTDDSLSSASFARGTATGVDVTGEDVRCSCYVKRTREPAATISIRFAEKGILLDPFARAFSLVGGPTDASLVNEGEWMRLEWTINGTQTPPQWQIWPAFAFAGDLTGVQEIAALGTMEIRNLQAEFGTVATAFQVTPRDLDRKFPSLLLEGSRQNGWTNSEALELNWAVVRASLNTDVGTAPDGTVTAEKLTEDATAAATHLMQRSTIIITPGQDNVVSLFAKAAGRSEFRIETSALDGSIPQVWFNLATGRVGSEFFGGTGRIRALPDGWFRVELMFNSQAGGGDTTPNVNIAMSAGGEVTAYDGDGSSGIEFWGADLELNAASASSYIRTTGAAITRNDDTFSGAFMAPPQPMTVYSKFIESGSGLGPESGIFHIGGPTITDDPRFLVFSGAAGGYFAQYDDGITNLATASPTPVPTLGDLVELVAVIEQDGGTFSIEQHLNGVFSAKESVLGGATRFKPAFAQPSLFIGVEANAQRGFNRFLAVKVQRGVRSLDFMRQL